MAILRLGIFTFAPKVNVVLGLYHSLTPTPLSLFLYFLYFLFSYFVVLPMVFKFFIYVAPSGVEVKPDIGQYLSFIMRIFFAFGFSFEVPVVVGESALLFRRDQYHPEFF